MLRHGATYAGHPTCCAAALAVLDIYEREEHHPARRASSRACWPRCWRRSPRIRLVAEVRAGLGLLAAVQLAPDALERDPAAVAQVAAGAREAGVLLRPLLGALAVSPPLIVEREHLEQIADGFRTGLDRCLSGRAWHTDEFPELRSGPPWVTEEMVAAQPALARQMLLVAARRPAEVAAAIRARRRA